MYLSRTREAQVASEPDEVAGELEEAEVVVGLVLVEDEQAPKLREPSQRPLDHTRAGLVPLWAVRALVADGDDVRDVVAIDALAPAGRDVAALVEAKVRLLDHDGMVRIVVTMNWAKLIDVETTLPSAVEELIRQRDERQRA
jgi:hypothetical protein